LNVQNNNVVVE